MFREPKIIGSLDDGLILGKSEHEVFVFKNGTPIKGFRTDVGDCLPFIQVEAESHRKRLEQEDSGSSYTVGVICSGYGVYDGTHLVQPFVTGDERFLTSIKSEAEHYARRLAGENPSIKYTVREI